MKNILYLFFLFSLYLTGYPQNLSNSQWVFGNSTGINFNTSPPTIFFTNAQTIEAIASISDENGNLLFYTTGVSVRNMNNDIMLNGNNLGGDLSSSMVVILKKPGSDFLYYIFTVDSWQNGLENGFRYSIVDMSLENGNGAVIEKNILINDDSTEKITVIQGCETNSFWIIIHGAFSDTFYAYTFDINGINNDPVISHSGIVHGPEAKQAVGCMAASPNGEKLAVSIKNKFINQLFSFDKSTGIISEPITIPYPTDRFPYGVQFSPNNDILYAGVSNPFEIFQYDITSDNNEAIVSSSLSLGGCDECPLGESSHGMLQLGPENKLYFSPRGIPYLGIIHNPDTLGVNCNYNYQGIYLGQEIEGGLPYFPSTDYNSDTTDLIIEYNIIPSCNNSLEVSILNFDEFDQFSYYFSDNPDLVYNLSSSTLWHEFIDSGSFNIVIIGVHNCNLLETIIPITILPQIGVEYQITLCEGEIYQFNEIDICENAEFNAITLDENGCSIMAHYVIHFLSPPTIDYEIECREDSTFNLILYINQHAEDEFEYLVTMTGFSGFSCISNGFEVISDIPNSETISIEVSFADHQACRSIVSIASPHCLTPVSIFCSELEGKKFDYFNELYWSCASDNMMDLIYLLKSEDGLHYIAIDSFPSSIHGVNEIYHYRDILINEGTQYYQLKLISENKVTFSTILAIDRGADLYSEKVYWRNSELYIDLFGSRYSSLQLFDPTGRRIHSQKISHDLDHLSLKILNHQIYKGIIFLRLEGLDVTKIYKLLCKE